jgi:hypothetical protein
METFLELLPILTPTSFAGDGEVILKPLSVRPLTAGAIVTAPDITASLTLVAAVPGAIELFGPKIVRALSILTFSVYVPAQTLMVSPLVAASTAAWIVVCVPPVAHTVRVAADADVAPTTLPMVRVEAISESVKKLRTSLNGNLSTGLKNVTRGLQIVVYALKQPKHSLSK